MQYTHTGVELIPITPLQILQIAMFDIVPFCRCVYLRNSVQYELKIFYFIYRPKIGKAKSGGPDIIRRHNKGCNCKRSGCLKNYCECYEVIYYVSKLYFLTLYEYVTGN